jgi:hypothetical protein
LTLKPGAALGGPQIQGIVAYVAHAVNGLSAKNITLLDQTGAPLWNGSIPLVVRGAMPVALDRHADPASASANTIMPIPGYGHATRLPLTQWRVRTELAALAGLCAIVGLALSLLAFAERKAAAKTINGDIRHSLPSQSPAVTGHVDEAASPFAFLADISAGQIASLLAGEMPQTITVVLARLAPAQAGMVLASLDDGLRAEVARRIAAASAAPPREALETIAGVLMRRLAARAVLDAVREPNAPRGEERLAA